MKLLRAFVAFVLVLIGRRRAEEVREEREEAEVEAVTGREVPHDPRAELWVAVLLGLSALCAIAFAVLYVVHWTTEDLGATAGASLAFLAAALIVAGKRVVPQDRVAEERSNLVMPEEERDFVSTLRDGTEGVSRRRLLLGAGGAAVGGLGVAAAVPLASLGPDVDGHPDHTPWTAGRGLVDEHDRPLIADDIAARDFVTAFPEGADKRELGSPVVIVRLDPATLHLPAGRSIADWAPEGLVAYSKICTHAGCAIAIYRSPLDPADRPRPALVCPCHYSTFDPALGAKPFQGPAGRALPQLPLRIGAGRRLFANGGFSGSVGPSWWSVKGGY
jgi:ubiquinol-cytochrome c reductase iron-sulfur subunit